MKYKLIIQYEQIINAKDKVEALDKFFEQMENNNETPTTWLCEQIEIKSININYKTATDEELDKYDEIVKIEMKE